MRHVGLYFIDLSNISHRMSRIEDGGKDTLAGVSYPHPVLCLGNLKKSNSGSKKSSHIFICKISIE